MKIRIQNINKQELIITFGVNEKKDESLSRSQDVYKMYTSLYTSIQTHAQIKNLRTFIQLNDDPDDKTTKRCKHSYFAVDVCV